MKLTKEGKIRWSIVFYMFSLASTWAYSYINAVMSLGGAPDSIETSGVVIFLVATAISGGLAFFTEES